MLSTGDDGVEEKIISTADEGLDEGLLFTADDDSVDEGLLPPPC